MYGDRYLFAGRVEIFTDQFSGLAKVKVYGQQRPRALGLAM